MSGKENDETVVLQMAQGKSDEHKMGALVLATKMGTKTPEFLKKLYIAIGTKFFCKLLAGADTRSAVLPVIATLVSVPEVSKSRGVVEEVCPKVLANFGGTEEEFTIIETVASSCVGAARRLIEGPRVLRVMTAAIVSHEHSDQAHKVLRAISAVYAATTAAGTKVKPGTLIEDALVPLFGEAMRVEDRSKFEVLDTVCGLLDSCADDSAAGQHALGRDLFMPWQECARSAIAAILTAKIGPEERCLALRAAQRIIEVTGDRWTCAPWKNAECKKCARDVDPDKFAMLLVSSAAVEVRVILVDKTSENVRVFAASIAILEEAAGFLAADNEEEEDDYDEDGDSWWWKLLSPNSLLYIRSAILDALGDILDFLEMCLDDKKEGKKAEGPRELFSMAAVRFLCSWIAMDPEGPLLRKTSKVLPYITEYIHKIFSPQNAKEMLELLEDF